ncbi:unnamed protein product [Danaus chrysippus]|uniref:(African queen) hypothetical protein n=1 Tax=Danaus chrysippus TaxID=151541 RepID=A0A8J2WCP1_9NEOP|nr:unnamed protein product [Danaus chrysippus]
MTNDQIYDHFKSTYEVPKSVRLYTDPNEQKPEIPHIDFHGIPPTLDEISSHIKRKSSKSAPGPDGIPYIVFKKCPSVRKHLINIYGKIWSRKQIPECFGKAIFVLIPKKDRVTDPKDTRPIALTNTISKIFFSVLQTRMTRFMLSNKYFRPNHQKGFLPGISGCLEHNTLLSESLKDARKSERQITVCWIDLENAFGSIQHELMLFALRWYNFPPLVSDMIASYYSKLKFSIITKEGPSKSLSYNVGLFQGCCLSPIVFNIVINILVDKLISNEKKWGYRFKFNNKYTESILAFADDLAILTRHPKHCQVLLDEVDKFCEWTDGLRTKPNKCHCLCLGRRNTRYTSYDPGLSIGGQCVSTVTENAPFKFLGRKIDNIGRTPSLEGIVDSFLNDLNRVDSQQISNVKKAWIYDNYLTSRLNWPFLVYDFSKTLLSKLDAGVIKMLKLWLGLALTADSSALFRDRNSFGMNLKRPSELYKHLRVSKRHILGKSHDDVVTSLPKDNDAPELESRLQFHKQFMIGAQNNRVGLGSSRKVQDTDILKSFIRQDENDKYKIHAMSLEMQNEWLDIGDFCIPLALKWRTLIHDWSPALLKFYLNAFQMTLPDQSNLVRWGKGTEKTCYICGKAVGTAKHLLVGCKVLLDSGQYSRRHDRVLEIIREAVSLSVARAQREITTNERSIGFVREGTRAIKSNVKPYSILKAASDWTIMMDTYEKQYKIPEDICASASRPDIFLYSRILKRVVMIELTVPWETNIPKDHAIKVNKYYELTNELTRNRFVVDLYAVEVGARGITAKSLYNLLKDLGLSRTNINSFLERTSKAALVGSFQIWLGRERNLDSGVDPHVSHGEPLTGNHQESINIRTRLSIPNMKQSTWKVHDDNLAVLLEHPGSKQELNSQVETFQNTVYDYFNEQYPPPKALGDNHLSHQLARALRSILKLIQGISAQTAEYRGNFDRAKQEVDFDKNPFEYSKTIFKKERGQLLLTNDQIYDHFKSTYEVPKSVRLYTDPNEQKPEIPHIDFHGIPPTLDEISSHIKRKSSKSAPGPDGIPYIVFKKCPSVRKHLINIYGKIWSRKQIPECFGKAIFVLIPKKDRVTDPKDTRPIALTNTISKIFFSVLQTRMTRFMLSNKYFRPNHQKGFLPGISGCLEHNTLLSESLKDARKSERQITVCWIDLENAFGSIQHELMLFALRWYNFPPLVSDMIASYYSKLKFSIITKEGPSKSLSYNVGLFQGCCLSPIVFNIVINILVDKLISNEKKWGYRFKFNNKYTESILAFADDLAILTRHPKHCQVLLDEVDKFCEWTDGLRTKPNKCHCLCLGRRNTRYTSYDPGLSIGGQCVSTVTENAPFKFLGRKIDNIGRTPSLEGIVDSFLNDLNRVDSQQISNVKKAWIYDNYLTSRLNWPFLVYDFSKTLLSKLDAGVIKMLKLWLGLALTADSSALFRDRNSFGMNLKRPSELYKHLRVSKRHILGKSHDDVVTSLPKDNDAPELESRLQFHKQFMIGAQNNRVGLGSSRKVQDTDILKSFIRQDENDKYKIHAMSLEMQNEWLDIGDFCIPLALKWRTLIHDWSPALLKFYLNAFQMTLPDQSNLVRWGKGTEKTCYICGKAVGTAKHLLVGCKVLLDSGQYSRRHDRVLEIIRFVREGTRAIKSNVKPYSILKAASDWTIMMDTYEKQYKIPEDICASASRPDIFLYSRILKRVVMIELTVPWETNIPKDHAIKVNKYYELTNELTRNRFVVDLYAVEVGARGITAKSLYNLLKDLGLSRTNINSFLERTSKAALVGSFQIWLGRERNLDSGGERITRVS